jgi:hypothetical protein
MASLTSVWVSLIASAWAYMPVHGHPLLALAAVAVLSYSLGYVCSQMQFPGRLNAGRKPRQSKRPRI